MSGMNPGAHAALGEAFRAAGLDQVITVDARDAIEDPERNALPPFGTLCRTRWSPERVAEGKLRALYLAPSALATVLDALPPSSALFAADPWAPKISQSKGALVVQTGPGGGGRGDPRARFAVVDLDQPEGAEIVFVPYAPSRLLEPPLSAARHTYLHHLLASGSGEHPRLEPGDRGAEALVKLLVRRTAQAFGPGSQIWPQADVELVHDVRVATRRLRAALAVARPLVPKKALKRTAEAVADYGRDLGVRRAADVSLEIVRTLAKDPATSETEGVVLAVAAGLLELRRSRSTARLTELHPPESVLKDGLRVLDLVARAKNGRAIGAGISDELAIRRMALEEVLGRIERPLDDEGHHEIRIAMKRLRYTLEIAHEAFPEAVFGSVAHEIRHLQEALGDLHDTVDTIALLSSYRVRRRCTVGSAGTLLDRLKHERLRLYELTRRAVDDRGSWIVHTLRHAVPVKS